MYLGRYISQDCFGSGKFSGVSIRYLPTMNHNLHTQCSLGDLEAIVNTITRYPGSEKSLIQGWSPLMYASHHGRVEVVTYLVENGADLLIADGKGQTALILAASSNNIAILSAVYDERIVNASDENGWTALFHAVNVGFEPGLHFLLQHKANINHRDKDGSTALMLACSNGAQNIIQILINYNADKSIVNCDNDLAEDIIIKYSSLISLLQLQTSHSESLAKLLHELHLDKYYPIFQEKNIGLTQFAEMHEEDLKNVGIKLLGPRRKMYMAICKLKGEEYKKNT